MAKCQTCGGKGSVKCPKCKGAGRHGDGGFIPGGTKQCDNCHGSGVVKCGVCHVKGYV